MGTTFASRTARAKRRRGTSCSLCPCGSSAVRVSTPSQERCVANRAFFVFVFCLFVFLKHWTKVALTFSTILLPYVAICRCGRVNTGGGSGSMSSLIIHLGATHDRPRGILVDQNLFVTHFVGAREQANRAGTPIRPVLLVLLLG